MQKTAIILAAGQGTRMGSDGPKVLCEALGRPLIDYVLDALERAGVQRSLVVVGHQQEKVRAALGQRDNVELVEQRERLGTGHAALVCRDKLKHEEGPVLIVAGDSPLIQPVSVQRLFAECERLQPACLLGTVHKTDPTGLGRIVRDAAGAFFGIVEERDADPAQRQITEVNMSTYMFACRRLLWALEQLGRDNKQGEYYLTDCPGILRAAGDEVVALPILKECESLSVNTPAELAAVEESLRMIRDGAPP